MPDLERLPWKMKDGAKEFHLVAEHVRREVLPDQWFDFWGYNGSMPGPLIEAVEGDRVRIIAHNKLPEPTVVHWHGLENPNAMDGVDGLTQDPIPPGGTFTYEFTLHQNGTFFYHSHGAMQEVMGMLGLFVIHPKQAYEPVVDHDFAMIVQEFAILPQSTIPNSISESFNFLHDQRSVRPVCDAAHRSARQPRADSIYELERNGPSSDAPARPHVLDHGHRGRPDS